MGDKTFELLTKMYSEFSEFRTKIETSLEHDIKNSLQALHERAKINTEKLDNHTQRLETIENKLDYMALSVNAQDLRLEVVEKARKKAK